MAHTHQEPHFLFPEFWIPHTTLLRLDEEGEEWECPFCGCPHKALAVDDETVSFVALESRECWKSFEEECPECCSTYQCVPGCSGRENMDGLLADIFRNEDCEGCEGCSCGLEDLEDLEEALVWEEMGEPLNIPGGLPMFGGPFLA